MLGHRLWTIATTTLLLVISVAPELSAGPPARTIDEASFNRLTRVGPFSFDIQGKCSFRVPTGYRIVTDDKLEEFGELTALPILGDESGLISMADKPTWFASILVVNDDPLKGLDSKAITEPGVRLKLLDWQRQFQDSRRTRKGRSVVPTKVSAWTHPPKFDEKTKVLTMGVRLEAETELQKDKVNYQSFVYGSNGAILLISAIVDVENYDKAEKESGKLTSEFTFLAAPVEASAAEESDDSLFLAKVVGGGLLGAVGVLILFKLLLGGSRKPAGRSTARRPVAR